MEIKKLPHNLTVCKIESVADANTTGEIFFLSKTDEEISLVCPANEVPGNAVAREDGWKAFRIQGVLDFSLIGILSKISGVLAENGIGLFAISTFNTDYILVKESDFEKAGAVLAEAGYTVS